MELPYGKKLLPHANKTFPYVKTGLPYVKKTFLCVNKTFPCGNKTGPGLFLPIIVALAPGSLSFIPIRDGDFDEFQKNFVTQLGSNYVLPDGTAPILRVYLNIPDEDWNALLSKQTRWNSAFARGGKEAARTSAQTIAKQTVRRDYQKFIRDFAGEHIRKNKKASEDIKRALKLTVPDTVPSPVHSTDAPYVDMKNTTGGFIRIRARRTNDATRASMLRDYQLEMRYAILLSSDPPPANAEADILKIELSTKALFTFDAKQSNRTKILYAFFRYRHLHNPQFTGPWSNRVEIVIA